ncbi:hypothetical protein V8G54_008057, partial [Vigna mungo]
MLSEFTLIRHTLDFDFHISLQICMYIIIHIITNIDINKPLQPVNISMTTATLRRGIPTSDFHICFNFIMFCTFVFTMTTSFLNLQFSINITHLFQHTSCCLFNSMALFLHNNLNLYLFTHLFFFTTHLF